MVVCDHCGAADAQRYVVALHEAPLADVGRDVLKVGSADLCSDCRGRLALDVQRACEPRPPDGED